MKEPEKLEVIDLHESESGARLAILYIPLPELMPTVSLDRVRSALRFLERSDIKTVVIPPFMPHCIISPPNDDYEQYSISKKAPYVKVLRQFARLSGLNLISPYIFEKSRRGVFISNLFIEGRTGTAFFTSRMVLCNIYQDTKTLHYSSSLELLSDNYINYAILLDKDALIPEFARILTYMGAHIVLTTLNPALLSDRTFRVLVEISHIIGVLIVHVGYYITGEKQHKAPLLVIDRGRVVFRYEGDDPLLVTTPIKIVKESRKSEQLEADERLLLILYSHLRKLMKLKKTQKTYI
jgi:hypothetical protein